MKCLHPTVSCMYFPVKIQQPDHWECKQMTLIFLSTFPQLSPVLARSSPLSSEVLRLRYGFSFVPFSCVSHKVMCKVGPAGYRSVVKEAALENRIGNWGVIYLTEKFVAEVLTFKPAFLKQFERSSLQVISF